MPNRIKKSFANSPVPIIRKDTSTVAGAIRCKALSAVGVDSIKPRPGNPRIHSKRQVSQIAQSIVSFGFVTPVLVDKKGQIIAGEGRWRAAKQLGLKKVPTVSVEGLSEEEIRAYVIADNQLALGAEWDMELLAAELNDFELQGLSLDILGFDAAELDAALSPKSAAETLDQEASETIQSNLPVISRVGSLFRLGRHRLLCGDACDDKAYQTLLGNRKAQMIFSDLPYNVPIQGNVSGLGRIKHSEFVMASGEMSPEQFQEFLRRAITLMVLHSIDGSIHYLCMDWRHIYDLISVAQKIYQEFKNLCVWNKTNAGMGTFYRSKHELVPVFKKGSATHINNFGLGQWGRHRSNVWDYAGANTLTRERLEQLALHPTVKPVAMIADAIKDCSRRGGLILDPFCGSGSTLLAAEITGRCCAAMELDPKYVDVTIRRWQKVTGEPAVDIDTGKTFDEQERKVLSKGGSRHGR